MLHTTCQIKKALAYPFKFQKITKAFFPKKQ